MRFANSKCHPVDRATKSFHKMLKRTKNDFPLSFKFARANVLQSILDAIKDLIKEGTWDCNKDGIKMQAMDSAHIFLCFLTLDVSGFTNYVCEMDTSFSFSLSTLGKILKCASGDDSIEFHYVSQDVVNWKFENARKDRYQEIELRLMDIQSEGLIIPDHVHECQISLSSKEFKDTMTDLAQFGEECIIQASAEGVTFSVKGDTGLATTTLTPSKERGDQFLRSSNPVRHVFGIRSLVSFTKAAPLSPSVTLYLSAELPLVVEYIMKDIGSLKFYLAPKLEEN